MVAAPQNETSIAMAGIPFDGHPSFVARETGTDENNVFMMLCFGEIKIAHATLHQSVRQAIEAITPERVGRVIRATDHALAASWRRSAENLCQRPQSARRRRRAVRRARRSRSSSRRSKPPRPKASTSPGPFGADTMFHRTGVDAFVVMLHDQGHIAAKLLAQNAAAALTIGTPILFSSVAHGSAHDIAGRGMADPRALIEAVLRLAKPGGPASP